MNRNKQLIRVLNLVFDMLTLQTAHSIKELALKFSVHPKTIRRDMIAIKSSNFGLRIQRQNEEKTYSLNHRLEPKPERFHKQ